MAEYKDINDHAVFMILPLTYLLILLYLMGQDEFFEHNCYQIMHFGVVLSALDSISRIAF